ncbi:MAG: hypothetical protein RLZZ165_2206 [Bacteroidota bacterium]
MNTLPALLACLISIFIPIHALCQKGQKVEHPYQIPSQVIRDSKVISGGGPRTITALDDTHFRNGPSANAKAISSGASPAQGDTHFKQAPSTSANAQAISTGASPAQGDAHLRDQPPSGEKASSFKPLHSNSMELGNAWPNPTSGESVIPLELSAQKTITMDLVNALGQQVALIASGEFAAGNHSVTVATDRLPVGVYYYILRMDDQAFSKRLVVAK